MLIEYDLVIKIFTLAAGIVGWTWAILRYIFEHIDKLVAEERSKREEAIVDLTKRRDFDHHVDQTEKQLAEIRNDIKVQQSTLIKTISDVGTQLNTRLDNLMLCISRQPSDK